MNHLGRPPFVSQSAPISSSNSATLTFHIFPVFPSVSFLSSCPSILFSTNFYQPVIRGLSILLLSFRWIEPHLLFHKADIVRSVNYYFPFLFCIVKHGSIDLHICYIRTFLSNTRMFTSFSLAVVHIAHAYVKIGQM